MASHLDFPGIVPVLAWEAPCPGKLLSPKEFGMQLPYLKHLLNPFSGECNVLANT